MIDLSNVAVAIDIAAPPDLVWDLVTDLDMTPVWHRETESTVWLPPHTGPEAGAVFRGTNVLGENRWSVDCHVIVADRPTAFEWTVLDPATPSSTWRYRLTATADGTQVDHGFQHGPGPTTCATPSSSSGPPRGSDDPNHLLLRGRATQK